MTNGTTNGTRTLKDIFPAKCLVCGGKPIASGIYMGRHNSETTGEPPAKHRYVTYSLCATCAGRKDILERVEKYILSGRVQATGHKA